MEQVDTLVVGSGFGGSVAAYRLAEAGHSVVLMERGQPFPPGSFPRSPAEMGRAFWDPDAGLFGMFDVWSFKGCDSIVSSGLGGGSLIYANVMLRKDERWFVNEPETPDGECEPWPITRDDLEPHYDAVEEMLQNSPYPLHRAPFDNTPKAHAMHDAAAELGLHCTLPPLAVSFAPEPGAAPGLSLPIVDAGYGNLHGLGQRRTCRLCGECDIGCNDGAKNSLDHNYLSAAEHHGADLRTAHEVKAIRPRDGGGYEVDYLHHDIHDRLRKRRIKTIGCNRLVLAAGTYGTTLLLLRSKKNLPGISDALGTRFCGNGDLLTFLLKAKDRNRVRELDASRGPVITSAIRLPDERDGFPGAGRGAYIQDGGYPEFVNWMVHSFDGPFERALKFMMGRVLEWFSWAPDTNLSKELSELFGDGALSISSLPLLGMGRDTADGVLELKDGRLNARWTTETSEVHFERLRKTMQSIADVLGADYADNPMWFRKRVITAHPLGGAPMGATPDQGVCDAFGEVFGFPGLYIADGAAMPGPVGPNPSLTIAAMSDRMSTRLLEEASAELRHTDERHAENRHPDTGAEPVAGTGSPDGVANDSAYGSDSGEVARTRGSAATESDRTSLSFTEEMKGFITFGATEPRTGELGEGRERMSFRLTITADDVARFLAEPEHTARAEGWIDAAGCGGRRPVQRGWFNLFASAGAEDRRLMKYRLYFTDGQGRPRTLAGEKNVLHGPPTRIWPDTSTLYVRVLEGHVDEEGDADAVIVGAGVLHIQLADFARQLTTFRTSGPGGPGSLIRFGRFFAGELWEVYGPDLT
ncbi:GMC oxidoreductase [Actinomadura rudentiformis]|uniref:GMC oxidoreductase n=1 Tax=Actinomadura rudentiformis TaxID=359158 RepID=UPI001CEF76AE|nr:GMC family oxidoreductase [Actinomadura rudentiformis]